MSATVGAALKKIAVSLLTDKKVLKVVGGIVLGIIIIIVMPIVAIVSIFNGTIEFDTAELQQMVEQNLSAEELAKLQGVEDTMYAIEDAMTAAGYDWQKVREAQVLYTTALYEFSFEPDFVSKLVDCFAPDQTDEQLIAAVNAAVDIPVLRPLIGSDKLEIIDVAKRIGTFEISSRPADDCCTLFMPRSPETHARIVDCERAEQDVPIDAWVEEILSNLEYRDYPCPAYKPPRDARLGRSS